MQYTARAMLVASLIGVLVWGLCGCAPENPPEEVAEQYLELWQEANYEHMYQLLNSSSRESYEREYFLDRHQNIFRSIRVYGLDYSIETEEMKDAEDGAVLPFSISLYTLTVGEISLSNSMHLEQRDDGEWEVDWSPQLIFPELSDERTVRVYRQEPQRGRILDRHGNPLAHYQQRYEVFVVPGSFEDEDELIRELGPLIDMDAEDIQRKLAQEWVQEGWMVPLKLLSPQREHQLTEIINIPGVGAQRVEVRTYPEGDLVSPTMGYLAEVSSEELERLSERGYRAGDMVGKSGIEWALEERLGGRYGFRVAVEESGGEEVAAIGEREVEHGEDIRLTLDLELQRRAGEALGDNKGSVVVLNAGTGEVLALVSRPSFDPNLFIPRISSEEWAHLRDDPDGPFLNRSLRASFPPGSAYKPFTGLFALEEEVIAPDEQVHIEGKAWQADGSWGSFQITRVVELDEPVDMHRGLMYSDNIYFAQLALELGSEVFVGGNLSLGFNERVPFTLPVSRSQIRDDAILSDIELAVSGFGQGSLLVSPLHLSLMYSALARQGHIPEARLLKEDPPAIWKEHVFSRSNTQVITQLLVGNLESPDSPSHHGRVDGAAVAGKTGTAETDVIEGNVCWYATYALHEEAPLVVVVMVEGGDWASRVALPIGRDVLAGALQIADR